MIGWLGPKRKLGWAFLASASSAVRFQSRQQHPKHRPHQRKQSFHVSLRGQPRVLCKVLVEAKSVEAANPVEPPLCLRQPVTLGKPSCEGATSARKGGVGVSPPARLDSWLVLVFLWSGRSMTVKRVLRRRMGNVYPVLNW